MPEDAIMFTISGIPHAQPRPRWIGKRMVSCIDKKTTLWADRVRKEALEIKELCGFLEGCDIDLQVCFKFPTQDLGKIGEFMGVKPDIDNLMKLIMDNIFVTKGKGLFKSGDERVAKINAWKMWSEPKDAGVTVVLRQAMAFSNYVPPLDTPDDLEWLNLASQEECTER